MIGWLKRLFRRQPPPPPPCRANFEQLLDDIYDRVDDKCWEGDWLTIDRWLSEVDVAKTDPCLLLGWLTITYPAKPHLKNRERFYKAVYDRLRQEHRQVDQLLSGLK